MVLTSGFFFDVFSIVLINVLLSGDNAVVIAMAVKSLPPSQRRLGVMIGAGGAAILRVGLTFFAWKLLDLHYVQFVGGLLILWIAVKLLTDAAENAEGEQRQVSLWRATWIILVADVTMSTDNVLAIAAVSKGQLSLLIFGLGLSIAFVVSASTLLVRLMDRFPVIVYIGAAILGRVGGDMMISDPWMKGLLNPSRTLEIGVEIFFAIVVLVAGRLLSKRNRDTMKVE